MSTDYSSTESIDMASAEHAEALLKIVTPLGDEGEGEEGEEGEGDVGSACLPDWPQLELRDDEGEGVGEGEETLRGVLGREREVDDWRPCEDGGMMDTLTSADCESAREMRIKDDGLSDSHTSIPPAGTINATSPSNTTEDPGTGMGPPDSPFSLSGLDLPATPLSVAQKPQSGMSWWADALAETQDMDDIDALVEQLDGTHATPTTVDKRKLVEGQRDMTVMVGKEEEGRRENAEEEKVGEGRREEVEEEEVVEEEGEEEEERTARMIGQSISPEDHASGSSHPVRSTESHRSRDHTNQSLRRTPSPSMASTGSAHSEEVAYIAQAGRLIRLALQYEQEREYEEAFDLFKAAVDVLLNGVQSKDVMVCMADEYH